MQVGFIGSGNMARALARGWGDPVLCTDTGSGRAAALAAEVGGEALSSNAELAARADLIILAHKPAQLEAVAAEVRSAVAGKVVVSILGRTPQTEVRAHYSEATVLRIEPNTPVELRRGVLAFASSDVDEAVRAPVRDLFARLGAVVEVPEALMGVAGACSGVGPAYWALFAEAHVEAAIRRGMPAALAQTLVTETMAGAAALIEAKDYDTLGVRRAVASPGGTTARGLAALERGGVRAALHAAMDDVVG